MNKIFIFILPFSFLVFSTDKILSGKITGITSGDFVSFQEPAKPEVRIHLYGIDCPEEKQSFGFSAETFISDLIKNHPITPLQCDSIDNANNQIKPFELHCSNCRYSNSDQKDSICPVCAGSSEILQRRISTLELLEHHLDSNINLYARYLIDGTSFDKKIDLSLDNTNVLKTLLFNNPSYQTTQYAGSPCTVNNDSIFNRFTLAIQYYKFAIESDLKNHGQEYLDIAISNNNTLSASKKLKKYEAIFKLYNEVYKSHSFESNPEFHRIQFDLHSAYIDLKQLSDNYNNYYSVFKKDKSNFHQKYPKKSIYKLKVGLSLYDLEKYKLLLNFFEKSYSDDLKKINANHLDLGLYCKLIGLGWHELGDFKNAERYYKLALLHFSKLTDSCNIATINYDLGLLYYDNCEYKQSNNYFMSAYSTFLDNFGNHHPITSLCQNNIGIIFYIIGEYNKANEYYSISLSNFSKFYKEGHPYIITVLQNKKNVIAKLSYLK